MNVLIVGCGVIGTIYGWALSNAGHQVSHLVRSNKRDSFNEGIKLDVYDLRSEGELSVSDQLAKSLLDQAGRGTTINNHIESIVPSDLRSFTKEQMTKYIPAVITLDSMDKQYDLVVVPTKHTQLLDCLREIKPKIGSSPVLIFCAIWTELDAIDAIIPREQYLLGYAASSGGYDHDTMVINVRRDYRVGDTDGSHTDLLNKVITLFASAGFVPDIKHNMLEWLWVHHAINGGTIGSLLHAGGFDALAQSNAKFGEQFYSATLEAIDVLRHRGVDIDKYPDCQAFLKQSPQQVLDCYRKLFVDTKIGQRTMRSGHYKHSIEEMHQYYSDVLTLGRQLGLHMPTLTSYEMAIESAE